MSEGSHTRFPAMPLPDVQRGAQLWRVAGTDGGDGSQYVPYFYNPHLAANA